MDFSFKKKTQPQPQSQSAPKRVALMDDGMVYHLREIIGKKTVNSLIIPGSTTIIRTPYSRIANFNKAGYAVVEQEFETKQVTTAKLGIICLSESGIDEFCPAVADKIEIKDGYAYLLVGARTTRLRLEPVSAPPGSLAPEYDNPEAFLADLKDI